MEHLQRVWYASRERLPFRTPGSVPHCGTCLCSNCWDQIPRTCHVFTRFFTSNTPWYFLDFAFNVFRSRANSLIYRYLLATFEGPTKTTYSIDTCLQRVKVHRNQFSLSVFACNVWRSHRNSFVYLYLLAPFEGLVETVFSSLLACNVWRSPANTFVYWYLLARFEGPVQTVLSIDTCFQRLKVPHKHFCLLILSCKGWRSRGNSVVYWYLLSTF